MSWLWIRSTGRLSVLVWILWVSYTQLALALLEVVTDPSLWIRVEDGDEGVLSQGLDQGLWEQGLCKALLFYGDVWLN